MRQFTHKKIMGGWGDTNLMMRWQRCKLWTLKPPAHHDDPCPRLKTRNQLVDGELLLALLRSMIKEMGNEYFDIAMLTSRQAFTCSGTMASWTPGYSSLPKEGFLSSVVPLVNGHAGGDAGLALWDLFHEILETNAITSSPCRG